MSQTILEQNTAACTDHNCLPSSEEEQQRLLRQVISDYDYSASNLIQILHMAQAIYGYLPEDALLLIASEMDLPRSEVSGVVSFYSYFSTQPKGKHVIQVCLGTACYVRGGKKVLDTLKEQLHIDIGETSEDRRFTLEVKRCIGSCGLAPAVSIDNVVHKRVNPGKLNELLRQYP
jgi:NADH:ubiquinone oxidoreductase subunit E